MPLKSLLEITKEWSNFYKLHNSPLQMYSSMPKLLLLYKTWEKMVDKNGPAAEERDLRTYTNSNDPDQPAHARSLVRIIAIRHHNIEALLKI